jgi:type IV pilus assembly protein PilE
MGSIQTKGFTLIELMIAVAVVGILASIAYPSYTDHVRRTRRADAQGALMGLANAMERYFTQNSTYCDAAGAGTPPGCPEPDPDPEDTCGVATVDNGFSPIFSTQSPIDGGTPYYCLTIQAATATTYTLRATPINAQAGNGLLELDSTGVRRWDRDNDGFEAGENCWEKTC